MGLLDFIFGKKSEKPGNAKESVPAKFVAFPTDPEAKLHFEKLHSAIVKLGELSFAINMRTSQCVFFEVSGHVDSLELQVAKDKEDASDVKLFEKELSYRYDYNPGEEYYDAEEERNFYAEAVREAGHIQARLEEFLREKQLAPGPLKFEDDDPDDRDVFVHYSADPAAQAECDKIREAFARIVGVALRINSRTGRCVFIDLSGHVSTFDVSVRKSKEEYNETLFEEDVDYEYYSGDEEQAALGEHGFFRATREKAEALQVRLENLLVQPGGTVAAGGQPVPVQY
jgi:hypothetical protein